MTPSIPQMPLCHWQEAAIEVFCRQTPCELHELLDRHLDQDDSVPDYEFCDICDLIRCTVGCPLFRNLPGEH